MNRIKSFITISAFSLLVLALPAAASAQWGGNNRNDTWGNNGYGNIRGTVQSLQDRARNFDRQVNRVDDRRDARYDRYDKFDNLDRLAGQFKNATEKLANEYGRGRNLNNSRDEAQRVLSLGSQIDQVINNGSRNKRNNNSNIGNLMSDWGQIDRDLQTIARAYGMNYQSRNGGWRSKLPF